ncbi:SDR family NAD(P)-dependent oxidoreductase [Lysobacter sp. A03]|uniref:SDR family NAD(P)-dependent oxidoreductase n=1 Tax=Lysobacter sp. A03 TaxID=1199154 RepID=UPI0005B6C0E5|nr:SDR family NAD(P)-dependent oxidoreductase [Lysobacter sp. A03]KIQ97132.1 Short chain dehydrogenase [Lysobacter sp. A03]
MNASLESIPGDALAGRVVLLTGAHGGLGNQAAIACARAGAQLVLSGRKVPRLNRVYDAVAAAGLEPVLYPLDLEGASPDDYAQMAERIGDELGRLDGVLHCAADFAGLTPLLHTDPAAFARAIHVNLTAPWWLSQACLPLLSQAPDAALVFAVDDPARVGKAFWGGYGVAQSELAGLVGMLHAELASTTVRVSGLQPGPMRTALRAKAYVEEDVQRAADPERYAPACVTLLSSVGAVHRGQVWAPVG